MRTSRYHLPTPSPNISIPNTSCSLPILVYGIHMNLLSNLHTITILNFLYQCLSVNTYYRPFSSFVFFSHMAGLVLI